LGEDAIPLLVEALDSRDPVKVAYAAYCLNRLRAEEGIEAAERALRRVQALEPGVPAKSAEASVSEYLQTVRARGIPGSG